ncbi:MAG: hypothetical protein HY554_16585 [Elusimicrobia bacterium]|nr:hypothetical protein [Elusimicrobiota bacterium]
MLILWRLGCAAAVAASASGLGIERGEAFKQAAAIQGTLGVSALRPEAPSVSPPEARLSTVEGSFPRLAEGKLPWAYREADLLFDGLTCPRRAALLGQWRRIGYTAKHVAGGWLDFSAFPQVVMEIRDVSNPFQPDALNVLLHGASVPNGGPFRGQIYSGHLEFQIPHGRARTELACRLVDSAYLLCRFSLYGEEGSLLVEGYEAFAGRRQGSANQ